MGDHALALVEVTYAGGDLDLYFVPLAVSIGVAGESISREPQHRCAGGGDALPREAATCTTPCSMTRRRANS